MDFKEISPTWRQAVHANSYFPDFKIGYLPLKSLDYETTRAARKGKKKREEDPASNRWLSSPGGYVKETILVFLAIPLIFNLF